MPMPQATTVHERNAEVTTSPQRYKDLVIFGTIDGAIHAVRRTRHSQ